MKVASIVLTACCLGACVIPSREVRDRNRENWKLALIGEPIDRVVEDWGIPTGQIQLVGSDGESYSIFNWESVATYSGFLVHVYSTKVDKYAGGTVAQPACKYVYQKIVKRVWVNKSGEVFDAAWVCE